MNNLSIKSLSHWPGTLQKRAWSFESLVIIVHNLLPWYARDLSPCLLQLNEWKFIWKNTVQQYELYVYFKIELK